MEELDRKDPIVRQHLRRDEGNKGVGWGEACTCVNVSDRRNDKKKGSSTGTFPASSEHRGQEEDSREWMGPDR